MALSSGSPSFDWFKGLLTSTASATPELFGVDPLEGAEEFRIENPVTGVLSQIGGTIIPYAGWYKATKLPMLARFDRAVNAIGDLNKTPFRTGALREAARFAPFEAGRLAASQVIGDEPFPTMAADAAVSLGLGAGLGGLLHGVAAAGTRTPRYKFLPGIDLDAPLPLVMREMKAKVNAGEVPEEELPGVMDTLRKMDVAARLEEPRRRYVLGTEIDDDLNRLFAIKKDRKSIETRRFAQEAVRGFENEAGWRQAAQEAGLPPNFSELGQYFRHVSFKPVGRSARAMKDVIEQFRLGKMSPESFKKSVDELAESQATPKMAKLYDKQLTSMDSLGGNWFMTREEDGLYVMAKKVRGTPGEGTIGDQWVIFKTDRPGDFAQVPEKFMQTMIEKQAWTKAAAPPTGVHEVYDEGVEFNNAFPARDFREQRRPGALDKLVPKGLRGPSNELAERLKEGARTVLAPTVHQLKNNPVALRALQRSRSIMERAQRMGDRLLYGEQRIDGKTILSMALRNDTKFLGDDNVRATFETLDDGQLGEWWNLWKGKVGDEDIAALAQSGNISSGTAGAAEKLNRLFDELYTDEDALLTALDRKPPKWRAGHFGLPRVWPGESKIVIRDQNGSPVAVASGGNRRTAQVNAKRLVADIPDSHIAEEFSLSDELPKGVEPWLKGPDYELEKRGMRGYQWDLDAPTRKEVMLAYETAVRKRLNFVSAISIEDQVAGELARVAAENPADYRILEARLKDLKGQKSEFAQWQNKAVDRVMSPIIGTNSAAKIVDTTNEMMFALNLGMGKLSFPVTNAFTFTQTVAPEAALIMYGSDAIKAGKYSYFAAYGSQGKPVGGFGILDPMKLMFSSMRDMARPSAELTEAFARAVKDRVIDPRYLERYTGEQATQLKGLRQSYRDGDFLGWLRALNDFLPGNSERMARAHAFTVGWKLAKEYVEIADDDLAYRLAKQFTENTMYGYTTADRPRIWTTPAGTMLGLFKTWMFNYMASMIEYTRAGMSDPLRAGAWAPLLWQTSGTAAIGGLAATPLYWLADGFSRAFSDQSLIQSTYEMFDGGWEGDAIVFGLPSVLSGGYISLYSNVQSPASNPIRDANMLFSAASIDRAMYLGQAVGSAFDHWQATGENPARSPAVRDQIMKALAPASIQRAMAAWLDEDKIRSLGTGYPILNDVTVGEKIAYSFGFNPVQLDKALFISDELYRNQARRRERMSSLGKAFYEAQQARDGNQMEVVIKQAIAWGLNPSDVIRSSQTREKKAEQPQYSRPFRPQDVQPFLPVVGR